MKKIYLAPQQNVVSSRIRCSILAGSNAGAPSGSAPTRLVGDGSAVQEFSTTEDGGLGARKRFQMN